MCQDKLIYARAKEIIRNMSSKEIIDRFCFLARQKEELMRNARLIPLMLKFLDSMLGMDPETEERLKRWQNGR